MNENDSAASGTPCIRCGDLLPEDSNFCVACGFSNDVAVTEKRAASEGRIFRGGQRLKDISELANNLGWRWRLWR